MRKKTAACVKYVQNLVATREINPRSLRKCVLLLSSLCENESKKINKRHSSRWNDEITCEILPYMGN